MKRIMYPSLLALFIASVLAISSTSAQTPASITLSGQNSVPVVRTPAMGSAEIWVTDDTLYVEGAFSDLRGTYWSGHIHFGKKGETGNRLFRLTVSLNEDKMSGSFLSEENQFPLRQAQREALRNGQLYISIASARNQQGEIRGQIPEM